MRSNLEHYAMAMQVSEDTGFEIPLPTLATQQDFLQELKDASKGAVPAIELTGVAPPFRQRLNAARHDTSRQENTELMPPTLAWDQQRAVHTGNSF